MTRTDVYTVTDQSTTLKLDNTRFRIGEQFQAASAYIGNVFTQVDVVLQRVSTPTGNANIVIRKGSDDSIAVTIGTVDVSTLTTSAQTYTFTNDSNTYAIASGDKLLIEFANGTATAYIQVSRSAANVVDGSNTLSVSYDGATYTTSSTRDLAGVFRTGLPSAGPTYDTFGIEHIYASANLDAQGWYMGNMLTDSRVEISGSIADAGSGVWNLDVGSGSTARINIRTTDGSHDRDTQESTGGLYFDVRRVRGYLENPSDYRNVEITVYFLVQAADWTGTASGNYLQLYCRGGRHTSEWDHSCLGSSYKSRLVQDGTSKWAKEYYHFGSADGYTTNSGTSHYTISGGTINAKWLGYKFCCYDLPTLNSNGLHHVKLEIWVDQAGGTNHSLQNWQLMNEWTDDGGPSIDGKSDAVLHCNAITVNDPFNYGGPECVLRCDSPSLLKVKHMSVREIIPQQRSSSGLDRIGMTIQSVIAFGNHRITKV